MIEVLSPGLYSSIQDMGRFGFQEYGVPYSGSMDLYSAKVANALLGNNEQDAVLEMTMTGAVLKFKCHTNICITGAEMNASVNDMLVSNNNVLHIFPNDVLKFGKLERGCRTYLAVSGGFQSEVRMGSRSFYSGITETERLKKGDVLTIANISHSTQNKNASLKIDNSRFSKSDITVFKGPEFDLLSGEQQKLLLNTEYTISQYNNRMAYQLKADFKNNLPSIITSPVMPGTVQLTPSGKLIILMRDCQTTGGYPRVLQLGSSGINVLSQKYFNQNIVFKLENR